MKLSWPGTTDSIVIIQPWPKVPYEIPSETSRILTMTSTGCSNHLASPPQWGTWSQNPSEKIPPLLYGGAQHDCSLPTLCLPCPGANSWWISVNTYTCQTDIQTRIQRSLQWGSGLEVSVRANQQLKYVRFGRSADGDSLTHILLDFEGIAFNCTWIKCCNR